MCSQLAKITLVLAALVLRNAALSSDKAIPGRVGPPLKLCENRCLNEFNLPIGLNRSIVLLMTPNSGNILLNKVLQILLMERLEYFVEIEIVPDICDIYKRLKNQSNIVYIDSLNHQSLIHEEKDYGCINTTEFHLEYGRYVRIVSDELPPIVHEIVHTLELENFKIHRNHVITDSYPSHNGGEGPNTCCYQRPEDTVYPYLERDEFLSSIPKVDEACSWIYRNRGIVNDLVPRINLKMCIIVCDRDITHYTHLDCEWGLSYKIYRVSCSSYSDDAARISFEPNTIGIVAPKPFIPRRNTDVPIIFYDAEYFSLNDITAFPTVYNDLSYGIYKFALCDFMERLGWSRIAILSDDSEFSNVLKDDLASYLHERKILYRTDECSGTLDNFTEILNVLKEQDARVIFANIEEKNTRSLIGAVRNTKMNQFPYVWILRRKIPRGNTFDNHFVLSLSPLESGDVSYVYSSMQRLSLSLMVDIYRRTIMNTSAPFYDDRIIEGWVDYVRDEFRKNFLDSRGTQRAVQTVSVRDWTDGALYRYKYDARGERIDVTAYEVPRVPHDRTWCLTDMNTSVYYMPCEDKLLIVIPLVLIGFLAVCTVLCVLITNVKYIYNTKYSIL